MTQQRVIIHKTDTDGSRIVFVPLDNTASPVYAIVDELVFQDLIDMGLTPIWKNKDDRGRFRVVYWNANAGQETSIARIILDANVGQSVVFADQNPLNLKASNLILGAGRGNRRDRNDVRRTTENTYRHIVRHEYIGDNPFNQPYKETETL